MNTLILNPRAHRAEWVSRNPQALIENGGLLSRADLESWACDICMSPLDPDKPIVMVGGLNGHSLCPACRLKAGVLPTDAADCTCSGCKPR